MLPAVDTLRSGVVRYELSDAEEETDSNELSSVA